MRSHHVCMGIELKGNGLIGGLRNPEQRSRPRMPLSSGWEMAFPTKGFPEEKLPLAVRKWTLLGRPVAYIEVALSTVNMCLLYIKG